MQWEYGVLWMASDHRGFAFYVEWRRAGHDVEPVVRHEANAVDYALHKEVMRAHLDKLRDLGLDRWELVAVDGPHMHFKRPLTTS